MNFWQKLFGSGAKPQTLFSSGRVPQTHSTQTPLARAVGITAVEGSSQSRRPVLKMPFPLRESVQEGVLGKVEALVRNAPDLVYSTDQDGLTPLHLAALYGHKEVGELLLAYKAEVNARDNIGQTPLHTAAFIGDKSVAELLLAKGAEVNSRDNDGATPLHSAASGRCESTASQAHTDLAELLLAKGADVSAKASDGQTPLHTAAFWGQKGVATSLLAYKADINAEDKMGFKPLGKAGEHKDVEELLRERAKLHPADPRANLEDWKATDAPKLWVQTHLRGWTPDQRLKLLTSLRNSQYWPMEEAAIDGYLETLRARIEKGGCPKAQNGRHDWSKGYRKCSKCGESGYDVCVAAIRDEGVKTVEFFLKLGMDPLKNHCSHGDEETSGFFAYGKCEGNDLDRPLIQAIARDTVPVFKLMETYGVSLQTRFQGQTLLSLALQHGSRRIAEYLICVATGNYDLLLCEEKDGGTPLHRAANSDRWVGTSTLEFLTSHIDVNTRTKQHGWTPLHCAAVNNCGKMAEFLLARGADVNALTDAGTTPLHIAKHSPDAERVLAQHGGLDQGSEFQ